MDSRFQAAVLAAAPSYPNAIAWSDENLIAVASGHLVIILNPTMPSGPRGLITIPSSEPYPVGRVKREDLLTGCLLPTALSRDRRPCVRSISWSPVGMAPNSGCLLAVCTAEGHVKIYRPPFCDFCAEWIEVIDVSDKLYDYLANTNYGELDTSSLEEAYEQGTEQGFADNFSESCATHFPNSVSRKESKRRRMNVIKPKSRVMEKNVMDNCILPLLTAEQYACRIAMLSSLIVSWSPVMRLSSNSCMVPQNVSSNMFSILAVGGKSGEISVWRIHAPQCYSIEYGCMPPCMILIGLLQAHKSWVTAISLALLGSNSSPQILLASGSSDGSVRIWMGNGKELLESSGTNNSSFFILREVIAANIVPVSVLSLVVPVQSQHKMLLAVGKGSGSVEVWAYDRSGYQCDNACVYDAHGYIVTGLAWAFDGCCLYSSGQDDHVRCWVLCGSSLCEVPISSNSPGLRSSNLPDAFLSCLGVAVSPGNLVLAMVRNPDAEQLDPMYERRVLKAVVHFFWIGGQLNMLPDNSLDVSKDAFLGFPANELVHWESSILWSLKKFENPQKSLVMWDIIAALLAFKQSIPKFVDEILFKWLSVTYLGSDGGHSLDDVLIHIPQTLSTTTSRQLHLLNIICRRVILSELIPDEINSNANVGPTVADSGHFPLWLELLFISERELRERLVGLSFSALLTRMSRTAAKSSIESGYWSPVGVAQMEQWITQNHDHIRDQLKKLALEVVETEWRFESRKSGKEEQCSHCSASVPFDSPDVAFCHGTETVNGVPEKHKLARCATSMQVCTATPLWFCKCCHRRISKLAPETLFTMPGYSSDLRPPAESLTSEVPSRALCPFCGILLQRLLPDFLPSASPV